MNESEVESELKRKFENFQCLHNRLHTALHSLLANDGDICVGFDQFFNLLCTEASLTANLVELVESIVQPLTSVRNRAGEDRKLVDASNEIVLQSELHQLSFIDIVQARRHSDAKRLQVDSVCHLRVKLKDSVHTRSW